MPRKIPLGRKRRRRLSKRVVWKGWHTISAIVALIVALLHVACEVLLHLCGMVRK